LRTLGPYEAEFDPAPKEMDAMDENLEFLFKDPNSISGNCPAAYRTTHDGRPGLAIQVKDLSSGQLARLCDRADDEGGVWIPDSLGRRIAQYYRDQG
jgi:hypothetical protein